MRYGATILFLVMAVPRVVFGGVIFTEIMYDPEGSDTGREWVEIYNDGGSPVDVSGFKFFESGTNHGLTIVSGEANIPSKGYAVIADDAVKFGKDFPQFSGTLFDSSFSLNNTGETLTLKDKNLAVLDAVTYSSSIGASEDGNSLQKNSSGNLVSGLPTPGTGLSLSAENKQNNTASSSEVTTNSSSSSGTTNWPVEPQVFADAGKDKIVVVGASSIFEGKSYGLKKEPLENARYIWNFGDGATKEGKVVEHAYKHPGDYLVVLEVASGFFSGEDRMKVHAEISPLKISSITDGSAYFIEVYNSSNADMDVSSWLLALDGKIFEIPKNTFVMGGKKLVFTNEVTGLLVGAGSAPELKYPNGTLAVKFGENPVVAKMPATSSEVIQEAQTVPVVKTAKAGTKDIIQGVTDRTVQSATAINSSPGKNKNGYIWLFGVVSIIAVALGGLVLLRKQENSMRDSDKMAEEIEIIEG